MLVMIGAPCSVLPALVLTRFSEVLAYRPGISEGKPVSRLTNIATACETWHLSLSLVERSTALLTLYC